MTNQDRERNGKSNNGDASRKERITTGAGRNASKQKTEHLKRSDYLPRNGFEQYDESLVSQLFIIHLLSFIYLKRK